jgi:hypothetical protein
MPDADFATSHPRGPSVNEIRASDELLLDLPATSASRSDVADREVDERLRRCADHARRHGGIGRDRARHADAHPSTPLKAIVALPPKLPILTTGHCCKSLLNERRVNVAVGGGVVELCWTASQYSPALR